MAVLAGWLGNAGILYWLGSAGFTILLLWEHLIVKADRTAKINMAFATLNSYAGVTFCLFAVLDLYI
jgi:4-hydroxybenzoate polyprenyltransferase